MITLFLILCYFILIFNIIIPAISEKMRREYHAYTKYKNLKKDYICIEDRLFMYDFGITGIKANMAIDKMNNPLTCSRIKSVDKNRYLSCDSTNNNNILDFGRLCSKAYLDLFFTT
ncbi:hypothetical protein DpV84gp122 [Deerpox virus W-1170-84]|uniref:IMV membrane protein n=3 Tax=Cervidpoxvirus TaxID=573055 RepID=Q08FN1_DPV83|nr:hypothetical protein DpV83gp122 [Deerpox virus W-848-83]ABI99105.1 hypothetical protein DpV84gp122 [Deerpox virus W-1170-84]ACV82556.1 a21 [Cervidpoxvirus reindeer/Ontario/2008]AUI80682.1 IMv membrane protein [White-tailed deer poxvirus]AYC44791.1 hypothetical protein [Moosepox virus GoldyGopher14]ABI99276.1 hypothetical protein DpV83gp122 [Deerpox virus W-848-83]